MTAEIESLQKLILATMNEDAGFSYGKNPLSLSEEIATLISELKRGGAVSSSSERRTSISEGQQGHSPRRSSTAIGKSQTPMYQRDTRRRHVPHRRPTSTWRRASSDASCGRTSSGWKVTTAFSQLADYCF